ncbi:MAG: aspartyl protease family protein, partial [Acidobacteria bacterium]|nr:aspartyl protease family protein [Acidobacteriota bacterium]
MLVGARPPLALLTLLVAVGLLAGVDAFSPSDAPDIQLQLGNLLVAEGRFGEATTAFRRALASEELRVRVPARKGLVRCALRTGEFATARAEATILRQERGDDSDVLAIYGDAMWSSGLFDDAAQAYQGALARRPDDPRGHNGTARVLSARGRHAEALEHAMTAVRLVPREADFHHTLGNVYERMGRYGQAVTALNSFINLLPKGYADSRAVWAAAELKFLSSFGSRTPYDVAGVPGAVYTLPFKVENEKVIIEGRVNGSRALDFVVDTGAELTTISRTTGERNAVLPIVYTVSAGVGEVGLRGLQLGRVDRLEFGKLKIKNVPCIIKSPALRDLPTAEGESFSPLALGMSVTIDYARRILTLSRRLPDDGPADQVMGLWMHRLATVRGLVGGLPRSFVVDTGGQVISISTETANVLPRPPVETRKIALKVYGASGWDREAYLLPGVNLAFNDIRFDKLSVVVLNLRAPSVL